jgi:hypothetical protein
MDTISQFWNWFKDNNKGYTFLSSVDEETKEELLSDFLEQLHKYCENLYFEIGGYPDEGQELIITAEPKIDGWTFIAFKPPMPDNFKSKWDGLELKTEDMWFLPLLNQKTRDLGIQVCFSNQDLIKDNEILTPLLYKMLDTILGEKSFALDIHYVDTDLLPDDPEREGMYPILELPKYIEWHKLQATKSRG